ncbi:ABC transporter substrate-binding protein [Parafrankia colletiae]|uniref:ABC transporter substrate-binding protein n=1 Tax=Parafrankia colletiae TaxID=573497 RepID=A0A1S1R4Z8_9ACTN|nr:ABC transporter substrate-binding protein [Parafrankia colletiae]MCK9900261.1 ABC transporter substrate-binding protein [Frankia sp. Cpl3]OHV40352.1 ABC transporter substrate-binding protein [Parafrankia colletiae]
MERRRLPRPVRPMSRLFALLTALVTTAAVGLLAACGSSAGEAGAPAGGRTLTILWPADPIDLSTDDGFGLQMLAGTIERLAVYDALIALTPSAGLEYRLATSLDSDDGLTWTLRLRDGVRFSDGTPLDAAAVRDNWTLLADPARRSPSASVAQQIGALAVVDPVTLRITLKEPDNQFPRLVAQTVLTFIGSPTALRAKGDAFRTAPVGAGAFTVREWLRNDHVTLVRNPGSAVRADLDTIVIRSVPDETQRYNTLLAGGGDIAFSANLRTGVNAGEAGLVNQRAFSDGGLNLLFNVTTAPFDDLRARQAVAHALDPRALNKALFDGTANVPTTFLREESPFHSAVALPTPDRARAQALFDELAAAGKPVRFTIVTPLNFSNVAEWAQSLLGGFRNVEVKVDAMAQTLPVLKGGFQATLTGTPRFVDPYPQLALNLGTGGPNNYGRFSDPRLDAALQDGQQARDTAGRTRAYETAQRVIAEQLPLAGPLYRLPGQYIHQQETFDGELPIINDGVLDVTRLSKAG